MTTVTDHNVPLASDHPIHEWAGTPVVPFTIPARTFTPSGTIKGTVLYLQGSSGLTPATSSSAVVTELLSRQYKVVTLGWDYLPYNPYKYSYGSVSEPQHLHRWIKIAWHIQSVIDALIPSSDCCPYAIIGRSLGATAVFAWTANYHSPLNKIWQTDRFKGAVCDGGTLGSTSGFRWNDVTRTLNELSQMIYLSETPNKLLISYGSNDDYACPDYQNRLRAAVPPTMKFVSVAGGDHYWVANTPSPACDWVDQMFADQPLTMPGTSTPITSGSKYPKLKPR